LNSFIMLIIQSSSRSVIQSMVSDFQQFGIIVTNKLRSYKVYGEDAAKVMMGFMGCSMGGFGKKSGVLRWVIQGKGRKPLP
ncbi:MAG: hypothetical protein MUP26_05665, partial [Desulfobulbaceae bacterium]|nr:hypothetical protein [Desulfobulbaceae bacterium]